MDFARNKLEFPAGASPGIDDINNPLESTLPFGGEVFAPVACGNGYVDIASGRRGVPTGTPIFTIDQDIGPGCRFSGSQDFQWPGMPSWTAVAAPQQGLHTIAAIVKVTTENALTKTVLLLDTAATTDTPFLSLSGTEVVSGGFWGGTASALPGLRLGEPYFVLAAHLPDLGVNGRLLFLQKSLRTGETRSKITSMSANSLSRAGSTWSIGNAGGTRAFVGHIAAAWYSSARLAFSSSTAITELLVGAYSQLAEDPWSLWYRREPRPVYIRTVDDGVTGSLAATEAPDVANVTGGIVATGTFAPTEAPDAANINGAVTAAVSGTLAGLETQDAANLAGAARWLATLQATEAPDVAVISGPIPLTGSLTAVESSDAGAITASVFHTATLQATEAADLAAFIAADYETIGEIKTYSVTGKRTPPPSIIGTAPVPALTARCNTAATWIAKQ